MITNTIIFTDREEMLNFKESLINMAQKEKKLKSFNDNSVTMMDAHYLMVVIKITLGTHDPIDAHFVDASRLIKHINEKLDFVKKFHNIELSIDENGHLYSNNIKTRPLNAPDLEKEDEMIQTPTSAINQQQANAGEAKQEDKSEKEE